MQVNHDTLEEMHLLSLPSWHVNIEAQHIGGDALTLTSKLACQCTYTIEYKMQ